MEARLTFQYPIWGYTMPAIIDSPFHALAALDRVHRALAETRDLGLIKDFRDQARATRRYGKIAGLGMDVQNRAAEAKLAAERRAGEILLEMQLHGGDRKGAREDDTRLKDLGIAKEESSRWQ